MGIYRRKAQYHELIRWELSIIPIILNGWRKPGLRLWERWDLAMVRLRNGESFLL